MGTKLFPKRFHPCCGLYLYGALRWASIIGGFAGEPFQVIHFVFEVQRNFISWKQSYNNEPFQYYCKLD
ncbi:unnamed protein product [Orchesella dallaii]|uniref:Uncharacterized protein n=1 Tax=Orchesella dallaii TaxID=48710 RepID=A0ABP1R2X4_9HEXA